MTGKWAKKTRPRQVGVYNIFCAELWIAVDHHSIGNVMTDYWQPYQTFLPAEGIVNFQ
jgi:hypothetical protein